jgi:hypothetical protein
VALAKNNVWAMTLIPPSLPMKAIKNLGEQFCKVALENLTDAALKSTKVVKKAVMKQTKGVVGKNVADTKNTDTNKQFPNGDKHTKNKN